MPGFDGTGPNGMGPMTGGGRGYCNPAARRFSWRPFRAGSRAFYGAQSYGAYRTGYNRGDELEYLKGETEALKSELKEIENEISRLSVNNNKEK